MRSLRIAMVLAASTLVASACSSKVVTGGGGSNGGDGGSSSTGATTTGTTSGMTTGTTITTTTTGTGGGTGGAGAGCSVDTDCGEGHLCGFPESAGCSARGECFASSGAVCDAYAEGCACDGSIINIACTGLPPGYYAKPLAHPGACPDACAAVSSCLSTTACATDTDCGALGSRCDPCMKVCACSSAQSCTISASNYDQACTVDADCAMVTSTDYCIQGCLCGGSAINKGALPQFNADVAKTPLGSGALGSAPCNCPAEFGPCCRAGQCTATSACN